MAEKVFVIEDDDGRRNLAVTDGDDVRRVEAKVNDDDGSVTLYLVGFAPE